MNTFIAWSHINEWAPLAIAWLVLSMGLGLALSVLTALLRRPMQRFLSASARYWWTWAALVVTLFGPLIALREPTVKGVGASRPVRGQDAPAPSSVVKSDTVRGAGASRPVWGQDAPAPSIVAKSDTVRGAGASRPVRGQAAPAPFQIPATWFAWVVTIWVTGVALGLLHLLICAVALRRWKKSSILPNKEDQERFDQLKRELGIHRSAQLRESDQARTPLAVGFFHPMVLQPRNWALDRSEWRAIVIHELAHLARRDDWFNLLQRLISTFCFLNPAVWLFTRRLNVDREIACDDWVIAHAVENKTYAKCLTRLAETLPGGGRLSLAAGAWRSPSDLTRRVELLLDRSRDARTRLSRWAVACVILFVSGAIWAGTYLHPLPKALLSVVAAAKEDGKLAKVEEGLEKTKEIPLKIEVRHHKDRQTSLAQVTFDPLATSTNRKPATEKPGVAAAPVTDKTPPVRTTPARTLMLQEIEVAEKMLSNVKKRREVGAAEEDDQSKAESEVLRLKKELALYDENHPELFRIAHQPGPVQRIVTVPVEDPRNEEKAKMLVQIAKVDTDENVRLTALHSIEQLNSIAVLKDLTDLASKDQNPKIKEQALRSIGASSRDEKISLLQSLYPSLSEKSKVSVLSEFLEISRLVRSGNVGSYQTIWTDEVVRFFVNVIEQNESEEIVNVATYKLTGIRTPEAQKQIMGLVDKTKNKTIKMKLLTYLKNVGSDEGMSKLLQIAKSDPDPEVRAEAVALIGGVQRTTSASPSQGNAAYGGVGNTVSTIRSIPPRSLRMGNTSTIRTLPTPPPVTPESSKTIVIGGEVKKPGKYPINPSEPLDLQRAIAIAGGFTDVARKTKITITSKSGEKRQVNYGDEKIELKPGDFVDVSKNLF